MGQFLHHIGKHGIALGRGGSEALGVDVEVLEQILIGLLSTDGLAALLDVTHGLTKVIRGKGLFVDLVVEGSEGVLRLNGEAVLFFQLFLKVFPILSIDGLLVDLLGFLQGFRLPVLQKIHHGIELAVRQVLVEYQSEQVILVFISTHGTPHDIGGIPESLVQFL